MTGSLARREVMHFTDLLSGVAAIPEWLPKLAHTARFSLARRSSFPAVAVFPLGTKGFPSVLWRSTTGSSSTSASGREVESPNLAQLGEKARLHLTREERSIACCCIREGRTVCENSDNSEGRQVDDRADESDRVALDWLLRLVWWGRGEMAWWEFLMWVLVTGFVGRLVTVWILTGYPFPPATDGKKQRSLKTLVVLGSGGHTAEILNVVRALNLERYQPRCYIAAVTDNHSLSKARKVEELGLSDNAGNKGYQQPNYYRIYRSREVGQSYLTSIGTTLLAMAHAFWLVIRIRPDVILCNGPGTCLPICIAGFFLKVVGMKWVVMVYIESIARVQKLSLTGLLFYRLHFMDKFIVQWPKLQENFPRTEYLGQLM